MKIIVTGALGHIGSKLIRDLPSFFQDSEIVLIDNLKTQRYVSLFNLPSEGNYRFHDLDLINEDSDKLDKIFQSTNYIIHLAALTDAASSFENSIEVEKVNLESVKVVTKLSSIHKIKLIHVSSTSVYGTQNDIVDEDCDISELNPQSPYAESKLKEEEHIQRFCKEKKLKACIFRFGTIFGISPGIRFHTAVNKFCYQASLSKPISVWRTALDQKRPYLDINDAINSFIFAINEDLFDGEVFNIVTSNFSVHEITNEIKEIIPNLEIELVDNEIMNQLSYNVSSDKIKKLGFKFAGSIKQGISDTLKLLDSIKN